VDDALAEEEAALERVEALDRQLADRCLRSGQGCRPPGDGETRARTGPDAVPGRGRDAGPPAMARPGLEPVRTLSPVSAWMLGTGGDGETRTRTGDTTIFRRAERRGLTAIFPCKSGYT
jgi:hypothetical protein